MQDSFITSLEEAKKLLDLPTHKLLFLASKIRQANFASKIDLCAIINCRSGNCSMNCAFCAQSSHYGTNIKTFPLLDGKILVERILTLAKMPVAHIGLVTSGAALSMSELEQILHILAKLPAKIMPRICTSFGRLSDEGLSLLREAKITRYHHNLETTSSYYPKICQTQTWQSRKETVLKAKNTGFSNCTGGLFGLGEGWLERIQFAFELRDLNIQNIPLNFLHPQPGTPLGTRQPLTAEEALRIIAIFRLILPTATLRICGGRPITFQTREAEIFKADANALMIGDYLTTAGAGPKHDLELLASLGLKATIDAN